MASRFDTPARFVPRQTQVSQFVPLPFQEIARGLETRQQAFNQSNLLFDAIDESIEIGGLVTEQDKVKQAINDIRSSIDNEIQESGGDLSRSLSFARRTARDVKRRLLGGDLGALKTSGEAFGKFREQVRESDLDATTQNRLLQAALTEFTAQGGTRPDGTGGFTTFVPRTVAERVDVDKKLSEILSKFESSGRLIPTGDGQFIQLEQASENDIRAAGLDILRRDPSVKAFFDQEAFIRTAGLTDEQVKEQLLSNIDDEDTKKEIQEQLDEGKSVKQVLSDVLFTSEIEGASNTAANIFGFDKFKGVTGTRTTGTRTTGSSDDDPDVTGGFTTIDMIGVEGSPFKDVGDVKSGIASFEAQKAALENQLTNNTDPSLEPFISARLEQINNQIKDAQDFENSLKEEALEELGLEEHVVTDEAKQAGINAIKNHLLEFTPGVSGGFEITDKTKFRKGVTNQQKTQFNNNLTANNNVDTSLLIPEQQKTVERIRFKAQAKVDPVFKKMKELLKDKSVIRPETFGITTIPEDKEGKIIKQQMEDIAISAFNQDFKNSSIVPRPLSTQKLKFTADELDEFGSIDKDDFTILGTATLPDDPQLKLVVNINGDDVPDAVKGKVAINAPIGIMPVLLKRGNRDAARLLMSSKVSKIENTASGKGTVEIFNNRVNPDTNKKEPNTIAKIERASNNARGAEALAPFKLTVPLDDGTEFKKSFATRDGLINTLLFIQAAEANASKELIEGLKKRF